jgi:hypothetical protein
MSKQAPKARQSQLVTTYGVGALFPAESESLMIMGLDSWGAGSRDIDEPRLARALGVQSFRSPAVAGEHNHVVPVIRFPQMQYCSKCRRLGEIGKFCAWDRYECDKCKTVLVPSRFVICCAKGHIDDFPYFSWLHSGEERSEAKHEMRLESRGRSSSLADIMISCSCGVTPVSMEGSFDKNAMKGITACKRRRPWLGDVEEGTCDEIPRTLQRGSSNVWFPVIDSAISIPPWSEAVARFLKGQITSLSAIPDDFLEITLENMGEQGRGGFDVKTLALAIREQKGLLAQAASEDGSDAQLRVEEYKALRSGRPEDAARSDFVCTQEQIPERLNSILRTVSRVSRLREVRALRGFTRVNPFTAAGAESIAPLSKTPLPWLPAIEVRGEGIFIDFDSASIKAWEGTTFARGRGAQVQGSLDAAAVGHGLSANPTVSPRKLLIHAFAHALIDQLSLDAGYPASSLRERLYTEDDMTGVLIYTASSDSAGSLGGLAAMSAEDRLGYSIITMLDRMSWCSSDPVCIESGASGSDGLNLAACHSCLLLPETSCELNNTFLDRATLIGTPEFPDAGYFSGLLQR